MLHPETLWSEPEAKRAVLALLSQDTIPAAQELQQDHSLAPLISLLFAEAGLLSLNALDDILEKALNQQGLLAATVSARNDYLPARTASVTLQETHLTPTAEVALANLKVLGVGGGPGTIIPLSQIVRYGYQYHKNKMVIDPAGALGGQWRDKNAGVFFNNPAITIGPTRINGHVEGRTNAVMMRFLLGLSGKLTEQVMKGKVKNLLHGKTGTMARLTNGKKVGPQGTPAEFTIVSLGNRPVPIESKKMETNARQFEKNIERKQRAFTQQQALALDGKKVVIVGLGNSALAQLRFINQANTNYHVNIQPIILTHFMRSGIDNPWDYHFRADGTIDRLARNLPAGLTTNLELDIPTSLREYNDLVRQSNLLVSHTAGTDPTGIIPAVTAWYISQQAENAYTLQVHSCQDQTAEEISIQNVGMIFVLAGYGVAAQDLKDMGFQVDSNDKPLIRFQDGAAIGEDGHVRSNLNLTGFASSHPQYAPSVGTMPGMAARVPAQLFTAILVGHGKTLV